MHEVLVMKLTSPPRIEKGAKLKKKKRGCVLVSVKKLKPHSLNGRYKRERERAKKRVARAIAAAKVEYPPTVVPPPHPDPPHPDPPPPPPPQMGAPVTVPNARSVPPEVLAVVDSDRLKNKWLPDERAWMAARAAIQAHTAGVPYCTGQCAVAKESYIRKMSGGAGIRKGRWPRGLYTWQVKEGNEKIVEEVNEFARDVFEAVRRHSPKVAALIDEPRRRQPDRDESWGVGWMTCKMNITPCGTVGVSHVDKDDGVPAAVVYILPPSAKKEKYYRQIYFPNSGEEGAVVEYGPLDIVVFDATNEHDASGSRPVPDGTIRVVFYTNKRLLLL